MKKEDLKIGMTVVRTNYMHKGVEVGTVCIVTKIDQEMADLDNLNLSRNEWHDCANLEPFKHQPLPIFN